MQTGLQALNQLEVFNHVDSAAHTHTHQKMLQLDFSHTEKELKVDWLNQATEQKLDANRTSWLPS